MRLEIKELSKTYGTLKALDAFSVQLDHGIYGILGPNGAGKSTLLQILTGNLDRDAGEILFEGQEIKSLGKEFRRQIGYMPQEQICYPQFTLQEFLRYMAILKGLDVRSGKAWQQIDEILERVHLSDVRKRKLSTFSGGMKRRAILAQALLGSPALIILDEPTAGLDPKERIAMRNMIAGMAKERIVLLATHIASDIECIANEVIVMKAGHLIIQDTPFALIDKVRSHVKRVSCSQDELPFLQEKYQVSNYVQTRDGLVMHVITKDEVEPEPDLTVSLDEVYLYYCE